MHAIWVLKGQRSLRPHTQSSLIFCTLCTMCTWSTSMYKEGAEGGEKNLRMNFCGGKLGEDSLRPNSQRSCSHTCLFMGFSCLHHQISVSSESLYAEAEKTSTWEMEKGGTLYGRNHRLDNTPFPSKPVHRRKARE